MKSILLLNIFFAYTLISVAQQKLQKPGEFLGYEAGERFTPHHRVVDYFEHVATVMPNAELFVYGETYEHRPLVYMVITSQENFNNLEQIRKDNLRRAGLMEGSSTADKKAIIWLSYNVHGNEANSMEASMLTLYDLADVSNTKTQEWLKNTVVIVDPCINPDGRDRYANFYNQWGNNPPNPAPDANEHHEPWPGGRHNHYLFDLNRDWAWTTQIESKKRIKVFNEWLPQVHVDFHEQGYNNPYFFAPAAEPMHEVVSPWQRDFQVMIGKNNAKYFDQHGWLYFTKEVFDLYYPSYGDTYPTYNGAIGMTYEQAGGGSGGLTITTETGDPLTLEDRITHHYTTGLSTIEITSMNATRLVDEYEKYFRENNTNPAATYKTYVIRADNNPDKLRQLTDWMSLHAIRYGHTTSAKTSRGFDYQTQGTSSFNISTEDIIVNIFQPKSRFITTVFEPTSKLSDSLTYDITAWNLLYAYDLNAYALPEKINVGKSYQSKSLDNSDVAKKPYAYIFKYQSVQDVALLTALMKNNVKVRSAEKSFGVEGQMFPAGSLIVTRRNNEAIPDFDDTVIKVANQFDRKVFTAKTGFVEQGKDFGSGGLKYLKAPRIGVIFGQQTYSLSSGEIWHFFEQQIFYPITQIGTDYIKSIDLKRYDVLIIPDGNYKFLDEPMLEQLSAWVTAGGRLIVMSNALNNFADKKGFSLQKYLTDDEKPEEETQVTAYKAGGAFIRYEATERADVAEIISGAIYKISLDNSHPLGFGLRPTYYTLKNNELRFGFLKHGWNVGYFKNNVKPVQGFAGFRANSRLDNSLVFGVENQGAGHVIYMVDNPLFRSFWENGKILFANAVFMVGQ
jgi:hypothetical protein